MYRPNFHKLLNAAVLCFAALLLLIALPSTRAQETTPAINASTDLLKTQIAQSRAEKERFPKLGTSLRELFLGWQSDAAGATAAAANRGVDLVENTVKVTIEMQDAASVQNAIVTITRMNGSITAQYDRWIDAWVPVLALEALSNMTGVSLVYQPQKPVNFQQEPDAVVVPLGDALAQNTGSNVTAGVALTGADEWHAAGYTGQGIKVAIIDSFEDYEEAQNLGELPANITTYGTLDMSSRHGTAVAEIIHDMAPDAELTIASPSTPTEMAQFILALAQAGNNIISSSMGFYNAEPGDGTGPIADAIAKARNDYGTLYIQAAGNQGEYNWQNTFVASNAEPDFLSWDGEGTDFLNLLWDNPIPAGYPISLYVRWNDWPASDQDYDFYVAATDGNGPWEILIKSENAQSGAQPPVEALNFALNTPLYLAMIVVNYDADGTQVIDVMGHNAPPFFYNVRGRSLVDAATAPAAFSVAALDASTLNLEPYSSFGPTLGAGGSLGTGLNQPRISGFANVDTWSYGAGKFNGTSAATPHVSGAAALVMAAYPTLNVNDVQAYLEAAAVDMGDAGYDYAYGMGALVLGEPPAGGGDNTAPVVTTPAAQSSEEGDTVSLQIQATDAEGDTLSYLAAYLPDGLEIDEATGLISGTIAAGAATNSPYTVNIGVSDGDLSTLMEFNWVVSEPGTGPTNRAPVVTQPANQTNSEGATINLQIQATDADGDALEYAATGLPAGLNLNNITGLISGTIATGAANNSPYTVTVTVDDGELTDEATFSWTIGDNLPNNNAPVVTQPANQNHNEGAVINLQIQAADADGDALSYAVTGLPAGLSLNNITGLISGTIATGAANNSPYTVTVTVSDGELTAQTAFNWIVNASDLPGMTRIAPANGAAITHGSQYVTRLQWVPEDNAQWYHVFVSTPDYTTIFLNRWYRANDVCNATLCEINSDLWLVGNGQFVWWMTYYYDGMTENYLELYNSSTFTLSMPVPAAVKGIGPSGDQGSGGGIVLEWEDDLNVLWYQVWTGPNDYTSTAYTLWHDARTICQNGTCRVTIPQTLARGDYEFWIQAWNPAGVTNWQMASEFSVTQ